MSTTDDWHDLIAAIQRYAANKYGRGCAEITLKLIDGAKVREPVPMTTVRQEPLGRPPGNPANRFPSHSYGYRKICWPGLGQFEFSPKQAEVVRLLWKAWEEGSNPGVPQEDLLQAGDSDCARLYDLFRRHPAWNNLIVVGEKPGTYRLPDPEPPIQDDE